MRIARKAIAQETVAILERGHYPLPDGRTVEIAENLTRCLESTRYWTPKELLRLKYDQIATTSESRPATIEVVNETTLAGAARHVQNGSVTALNFASAKNAGGGFLNGAEAQEESLARASGLYASLMRATEYYRTHHTQDSYLYTHGMILSPECPVFRNDGDNLLAIPYPVTFITSAAPNAGAAATNRPSELERLPEVFRERIDLVLALAASQGTDTIILGAWGCGVFRNNPSQIAEMFADALSPDGPWRSRFRTIVFSVFDRTTNQATFSAFQNAFDQPATTR